MKRQKKSASQLIRSTGPVNRTVDLGDGFSVVIAIRERAAETAALAYCRDVAVGQKVDKDGFMTIKCPPGTVLDADDNPDGETKGTCKRSPTQVQLFLAVRYGVDGPPELDRDTGREVTAAEQRAAAPAPVPVNGQ